MFTLNLTCPEAEHVLTSPPPIITAYISRILLSRETDAVTLSRLTKTILKGSISYKSGEWTGVVSIAATEKSVEGRKLMCRVSRFPSLQYFLAVSTFSKFSNAYQPSICSTR